jgi:stage II sporulation protein AA (anti-sigma F factor antagonist)
MMHTHEFSIDTLTPTAYCIRTNARMFDTATAMELRGYVQQQLDKAPKPFILFDLQQVHFMDSFGLAFILSLYRRVQELQGKVILVGVHANVEQLINITKISKILPLAATVEEALTLI